jgi:hypothetical protein
MQTTAIDYKAELDKLQFLNGKSFRYKETTAVFNCTNVKVVNQIGVVLTNRGTKNYLPSEVMAFIESIEICEPEAVKQAAIAVVNRAEFLAVKEETSFAMTEVVNAEIIQSNQVLGRISEKMESMFNVLAGDPLDADIKQAEAMVKASNAIVSIYNQTLKNRAFKG